MLRRIIPALRLLPPRKPKNRRVKLGAFLPPRPNRPAFYGSWALSRVWLVELRGFEPRCSYRCSREQYRMLD
jgi:hypothetical protein